MVALIFSILVTIVIAGWLWFYIARPILEDYGVIKDDAVMSSDQEGRTAPASMDPAYIPVSSMPDPVADMDVNTPGMDAINTDMPRLSRDISDSDMVAFLAIVRGKDGKHRYSANAIFALVGGDRNAVLARVKEIRSGPSVPVYPHRTPEQEALRRELGLTPR